MPTLEAYFHYRNLDVSTLKILAGLWAPEVKDSFQKSGSHLALDDIRESIAELRHYRAHFLKVKAAPNRRNAADSTNCVPRTGAWAKRQSARATVLASMAL